MSFLDIWPNYVNILTSSNNIRSTMYKLLTALCVIIFVTCQQRIITNKIAYKIKQLICYYNSYEPYFTLVIHLQVISQSGRIQQVYFIALPPVFHLKDGGIQQVYLCPTERPLSRFLNLWVKGRWWDHAVCRSWWYSLIKDVEIESFSVI